VFIVSIISALAIKKLTAERQFICFLKEGENPHRKADNYLWSSNLHVPQGIGLYKKLYKSLRP
jgi:hypothetical protein